MDSVEIQGCQIRILWDSFLKTIENGGKQMGRLYTSLPLDNPTRQLYQNVIDNSRKQLVSQMASDRGKVDD